LATPSNAREQLREPMEELWQAHGATASRRDQFQLRMVIDLADCIDV
jgi:hypothetical protein